VELTIEQQRVVDHGGGPLRVAGGPGTGRTTALVARYLQLVGGRGVPASDVLVVCRTRAAALRFRDAVLPHLHGGFDALPVTTWFGVAFDLVSRTGGPPLRLLGRAEQRALVRRLLTDESPDDWPVFGRFLGREAFADEVAAALLDGPATGELARFAARYDGVLAERDQVDAAGLIARAVQVAPADRYGHVLVDDHEGPDALLVALAGPGLTVVADHDLPGVAATVVTLTRPFRQPGPPVLVTCPHPSTEAEAVAGELLAARAEGVAWSRMAVLVRRPRTRSRAIARALGRHGIPVAPGPGLGSGTGDRAVAAIVDMLGWASGTGDDGGSLERLLASPLAGLGADGLTALRDDLAGTDAPLAGMAFTVWERGLGHLVGGGRGDDTSLDAVVAFLDRLERDPGLGIGEVLDGDVELDGWRTAQVGGDPEAVTVTSIAGAVGREWHTVVVAGCVEGELPRIRGRAGLFDADARSAAERRQASLAEERRLFQAACSRATGRLVATAAPEPGVLVSRFVEGWKAANPRLPRRLGLAPVARRPTTNPAEVFPDGRLVLSASQLATYDDCPLRYAYQYGLRVRDEAGAPAALGSLVHEVLAEFLRPDRPVDAPPRSQQGLLDLAAERWRDDIARYRPQVEECRRDYFAMLESWWNAEGDGPQAPEVLAVEWRFDIEVGGIHLIGAIDRVDRAADGEGIRIVDYKTGGHEPRVDAMPDDLQLAVYHLAATLDPVLAAFGPPRELQLVYLRTMHRFEQPILANHAEITTGRVLAAAAAIRAERFEPAVDASCRTCPFHRLCPLQLEGREVGAA
jgi:superfamily I DNA/RNA helicase/RecB family exonuclease